MSNSSPFLPKQVLSDSGIITEKNVITDAFNQHFISAGFSLEINGGLINPGQSVDCSSLSQPPVGSMADQSTTSEALFSFQHISSCDMLYALLKICFFF